MASDREFLERRQKIIEEKLSQHSQYDIDERGGIHIRLDWSPMIEYSLIREARLIEKLLAQTKEGQLSKALALWHKNLGEKLRAHREYYRPMQEVYDRWYSLPFPTRIEIPEPPHSPELEVIDIHGNTWIVDSGLLDVLKDMQARLEKWNASDE
jgi:hypothetical protein